jgi:hypothetical protein
MLLSLPICYITTVLPIVILILKGWIDRQRISADEIEEKDETYFEIAHSISSVLMYVNSSINILLYILFGKNLRQDFLSITPCMNAIKSKSKRNSSKLYKYLKTKEHISINGKTAISKKQSIQYYNSNL